MQDRFVNGFISGAIAFLITTPISFLLTYYKLMSMNFSHFAAIISLRRLPETLTELAFGVLVEAATSAVWGVIFAYLVFLIGSKYLWFKGLVYAGLFWYIYALVIFFMQKISFDVQTAFLNGVLAGIWGIVMAIAFHWLQTRSPRMHPPKNEQGD